MTLADSRFVSRLQAQEEAAITELVDRYYEPIYRYLYQYVHDPDRAADLTQETFLKAYNAMPDLDDASNLSAWLFTIAANLARKRHRRRQLIQWLPLRRWHATRSGPEQRIAQQDLVSRVLEQLPETYKQCLLLHVWAGLTCAEIGEIVGKSEAAVKMTLVRARRRFRERHAALTGEEES